MDSERQILAQEPKRDGFNNPVLCDSQSTEEITNGNDKEQPVHDPFDQSQSLVQFMLLPVLFTYQIDACDLYN